MNNGNITIDDFICLYFVVVLCTVLIILCLCSVISQVKNLNHNLYFVFKANGMLGDISEESILFTKLDKKCCK